MFVFGSRLDLQVFSDMDYKPAVAGQFINSVQPKKTLHYFQRVRHKVAGVVDWSLNDWSPALLCDTPPWWNLGRFPFDRTDWPDRHLGGITLQRLQINKPRG